MFFSCEKVSFILRIIWKTYLYRLCIALSNFSILINSVKSSELRYRYCGTSRQIVVPSTCTNLGFFCYVLLVYNAVHRRYINMNTEEIWGLGISIIVLFQEFFFASAPICHFHKAGKFAERDSLRWPSWAHGHFLLKSSFYEKSFLLELKKHNVHIRLLPMFLLF